MTEQFLSLKEAAQHTGKSHSSLRRFLEKITKADDHADRGLIQPDVDEVARLHAENHPFSWRVSTVLLDREFAEQGSDRQASNESGSQTTAASNELLSRTITMLETELSAKNKQIAEFQERQRETNVLLQQTTEKLMLLTDGKKKPAKNDETVTVFSSTAEEEGSQRDTVDVSRSSKTKPRKEAKRESFWDKMRKPLFQR